MEQFESLRCPIERTAALIGDRWFPLIVRDLAPGCRRFSELQRSLAGISPKTLSDRLRRLEEAGIVTRASLRRCRRASSTGSLDKGTCATERHRRACATSAQPWLAARAAGP